MVHCCFSTNKVTCNSCHGALLALVWLICVIQCIDSGPFPKPILATVLVAGSWSPARRKLKSALGWSWSAQCFGLLSAFVETMFHLNMFVLFVFSSLNMNDSFHLWKCMKCAGLGLFCCTAGSMSASDLQTGSIRAEQAGQAAVTWSNLMFHSWSWLYWCKSYVCKFVCCQCCCFRCVIDSIAMDWLAVSIVTGHVNNGPTCLVACWGGSWWARPCLLSIHQEGVQVAAQSVDLWSERVFCRLV